VRTRDTAWTYAELHERAGRVTRRLLAELGPGPGQVALLFEHGAAMVAAALGVLAAGKAYVPLDASYPAERLRYMLEDSEASALVTNGKSAPLAAELAGPGLYVLDFDALGAEGGAVPAVEVHPHAIAYLLYTSGSTGRPKGVPQTHRNVMHHMRVWTNSLRIAPEDRLTLQSAFSWDSAVQDTFGALLNGAALYPVNVKEDGVHRLLDWFVAEGVTIYHSTLPIYRSFVRAMKAAGKRVDTIRVLALGGDPIHGSDVALYREHFSRGCALVNAYGATESSSALLSVVDANRAFEGSVLDLGFPVEETDISLSGADGSRVEGLGEGEIRVRSRYVSPGYWRAPAGEASRFLPSPDGDDRRIYCTGDLGRRLPDGRIALVGRTDFQVKIRGIRVELGEVEGVLKQHVGVEDAVVLARDDGQGERFLAAYVILREGRELTVSELRAHMAQRAPDHAVPAKFLFLSALPLTPNNKIDRLALPAPDTKRPVLDAAFAAPETRVEGAIAAIWREALSLDEVGALDNFFDLGGDSLRLAAVNARLRELLDKDIPMVEMYQHPTIRALAQALEGGGALDVAAERGAARGQRRAELSARRRSQG
jgi:amino acid adenylation domain-containing protein